MLGGKGQGAGEPGCFSRLLARATLKERRGSLAWEHPWSHLWEELSLEEDRIAVREKDGGLEPDGRRKANWRSAILEEQIKFKWRIREKTKSAHPL